MILDTPLRKLQIVLGAVTTESIPIIVSYVDITPTTHQAGTFLSFTTGSAPVDILPAPAAGVIRKVNYISISNVAATNVTIFVNLKDDTVTSQTATVMVEPQWTFLFTDTSAWQVLVGRNLL